MINEPSISLYYHAHDCALGTLMLVASPRGMCRVGLLEENQTPDAWLQRLYGHEATSIPALSGFFTTTCEAIDSYLGEGIELSLPFELCGGTALQRMVWLQLTKIPYGQTISYTDLANKVGFPRAVRAVASACGANPLPLVIPCHRVVAKDGTLGGFSLGGLEVKETLLEIERPKSRWVA